jgi:heme exporter protein C
LFLYIGIFAIREAISDSELRAKASGLIAMVGTVNIPIIKYSVDWWTTLHQPATFTLTEKPAMPPEMWLPALVMVLGFYFFAGHNILTRMRAEILRREAKTAWVKKLAMKMV